MPPLPERAGPVLEALAAELGETVMLAVPDGRAGARVVAEAAGPRMVGVGSWLGRTLEEDEVAHRGCVLEQLHRVPGLVAGNDDPQVDHGS